MGVILRHIVARWQRVALLLLWLGQALPVAAQDFIAGLEDFPLLGGVVLAAPGVTLFDTPQGRIASFQLDMPATGDDAAADAVALQLAYRESLVQLGWAWVPPVVGQAALTDFYTREGERLQLMLLPPPAGADAGWQIFVTIEPN